MKSFRFYILIFISFLLFSLGNLVYSPVLNLPWYIATILSEFIFVLMYTIVDYSNFKYKYKFAFFHILLLCIFYLSIFEFLFFSKPVQILSITIAIFAISINAGLLQFLYKCGLSYILCSRVSTTLASIIEILLFSTLLEIGLIGALLMAMLRPIYIYFIPKFIFK